ncbi:hypothetical protein NESM_000770200 [Novymonas esmeraldas]|uniref:Uncharacterized protein n=1 Tax=Novymonas esmeraldas TaxID=1808958 RepID=A0AAW0EV82_9TRYP
MLADLAASSTSATHTRGPPPGASAALRLLPSAPPRRGTSAAQLRWASQRSSAEAYTFPVGRALRYVELGRRHHYHQQADDGAAELQELLAEMTFPATPSTASHATDRCGRAADDDSDGETAADDAVQTWTADEVRGRALVAEVSGFAKHHAHQLLLSFRALRRQIAEATAAARASVERDESPPPPPQPRGGTGPPDRTRRQPHPHGGDHPPSSRSRPPLPMPAHLAAALPHTLFCAALLLRVSGTFGVAETHVERLLDLCFSVSIFLAQEAAAAASTRPLHRTARGAAVPARSATSPPLHLAKVCPHSAGATAGLPQWTAPQLRSLHWSIVHFAAGVVQWGLLEHTGPLQDVRRTQRPYERLLQAHAALLCEQTRRCVDPAVWHELVLLKAGRRGAAAAAMETWFLGPDAATYAALFGGESRTRPSVEAHRHGGDHDHFDCHVPPRLQQRRLQLLPLLWLSLLCSHLHASPAMGEGRAVTWTAARHAFAATLPLFSCDARLDVSAWAVLHLLALPHDQCDASPPAAAMPDASLTEVCAFLARLEHTGAMLELAASLPRRAGTHAATAVHAHLASLLRRWFDATAATATAVAEAPPLSPRATRRGAGLSPALHTPIRTAAQLYRALLNVPCSALFLPPTTRRANGGGETSAPTQDRPQVRVTLDGVRLVNRMLLRVLLQWRSDDRGWRVLHSANVADTSASAQTRLRLPQGATTAGRGTSATDTANRRGSSSTTITTAVASAETPLAPASLPWRRHAASALDSRLQWEGELVCVLKAVQHLRALVGAGAVVDGESAAAAAAAAATGDGGGNDDDDLGSSVALLHVYVAPTVAAAARALAEQLGVSLLPWRLVLLHSEQVSLTSAEVQLLHSLDAALRSAAVVVRAAPSLGFDDDDDAAAATPYERVGTLPSVYRMSMEALLQSVS